MSPSLTPNWAESDFGPTTACLAPLNELMIGILQNAKCPSRRQANMGRFLTIRLENERELSKWDPRWTRR